MQVKKKKKKKNSIMQAALKRPGGTRVITPTLARALMPANLNIRVLLLLIVVLLVAKSLMLPSYTRSVLQNKLSAALSQDKKCSYKPYAPNCDYWRDTNAPDWAQPCAATQLEVTQK